MNRKRQADKASHKPRDQRRREARAAAIMGPLNQVREQYANNWATGHAEHFSAQGDYEWMAGFLDGCPRIVEVGAGNGSGTIALCRRGAVVVGIEKNPFCLQIAERKLREAGIPVVVEPRGTVVPDEDATSFEITYPRISSQLPTEGALLLGGDVTIDRELVSWLVAHAPFDGIACWNIGTYRLNLDVTSDPSEYRLIVQNRVYEMAERVLRPGGVLHVVDRGREPTKENVQAMVESQLDGHRDQASTTSLRVDPNIQYRVYEPPPENTGISMQAADTSSFEFNSNRMAFWSIASRKP